MIGQTLSHYRILEQIGQGGMGVVYKALDLHLDRLVAVKTLPKDKVADPERRQRFIQEAKSASALNHPNIVTIHDIDQADGNHFITMEYIEGKTLHDLIRDKELSYEASLNYSLQIADALSTAHSAGIVHRDIKPSNVMITGDNKVKLLDFGLAKLTEWSGGAPQTDEDDRTPSLEKLTQEGAVVGTLSYMSPEQARGRPVDHRTDIFSLGVVIYQMMAGEPPFRGPHAAAVLDKLLYSPTPSIRSSDPNYPLALERTISRAMAKDPIDRYQSMQDMASDIQAVASGKHVSRQFLTRKQGVTLSWVVGTILLIMLIALPLRERLPKWLGGPVVTDEAVIAVLPFMLLSDDEKDQILCDGLVEILIANIARMENLGKPLKTISSRDLSDQNVTSARAARHHFGATKTVEGNLKILPETISLNINLVNTQNSQLIGSRNYDVVPSDLPLLERHALVGIVDMLGLELTPEEYNTLIAGSTEDSEAYMAYMEGMALYARFDVQENLDGAIENFRQAILIDPSDARAHAALAEACWRKWGLSEEKEWVEEAQLHSERAIEIDKRLVAAYLTRGIIYTGMGEAEKAVEMLLQAIELEPENARAHRELGNAYERVDKLEDAVTAYDRAIELKPDDWYNHFSLGRFYANHSFYSEAATEFQTVINLVPDHFYSLSALAGIYIYLGEFKKAEAICIESLSIRETPEAYNNLAASYIFQGRAPEAVPIMERAVGMEGSSHEMWSCLGDAYELTPGLSYQAPAAFRRAVEMAAQDLEVNPNNRQTEVNLAYYLIRAGDAGRALEIVNRLMDSSTENPDVLFWSALVYEWAGDREKALKSLSAAAKAGFSNAVIGATSDLDNLRSDPRYRNLIEDW